MRESHAEALLLLPETQASMTIAKFNGTYTSDQSTEVSHVGDNNDNRSIE